MKEILTLTHEGYVLKINYNKEFNYYFGDVTHVDEEKTCIVAEEVNVYIPKEKQILLELEPKKHFPYTHLEDLETYVGELINLRRALSYFKYSLEELGYDTDPFK